MKKNKVLHSHTIKPVKDLEGLCYFIYEDVNMFCAEIFLILYSTSPMKYLLQHNIYASADQNPKLLKI